MKKYFPNLIPDKHKVLPDYFKDTPNESSESTWTIPMWIISTILLICAIVVVIINLWFSLCLFLSAFIISPLGGKLIESNFRFTFKGSLKLKVLGVITIFTFFTGKEYLNQLHEIQRANLLVTTEKYRVKKEREKEHKIRLDSLNFYITSAEKFQASKNYKKAIEYFLKAKEDSLLENKSQINLALANSYFEVKDYKKAIEIFNIIETNDADTYFKQGICSKKIGDISSAIKSFKQASELGNIKAEREYNKINPIIRE